MRIAFDVKGTLVGSQSEKVLRLFKDFEAMGHEMFVWSNLLSYAVGAVRDLKLNAEVESKYTRGDAEMWGDRQLMDIAIDDDASQTWLAVKKFVNVSEIPENTEEFAKKLVAEVEGMSKTSSETK